MKNRHTETCKVRTITAFASLHADRSSWMETIQQASDCCKKVSQALREKGYSVQSIRIVTNPFGEYLRTDSLDHARQDMAYLKTLLAAVNAESILRLRFAIGEARTLAELQLLPELVAEFGDLCNACVNIERDDNGVLDNAMIMASASVVRRISEITLRGEGNFNFTVNVNCQPFIPYFPASYHRGDEGNQLVIGLETPDLLVSHLRAFNSAQGDKLLDHNALYASYFSVMREALQHVIDEIASVVNGLMLPYDFHFSGVDSSAAPSKYCASMTEVYQQMGVEYFGASGTVEASALLTRVFKSIENTSLLGFSGLMLALTEDLGLAAGSIKGDFDIRALLTYSAVCGIGLDTVPIPGDTSIEKIAALIRDTGTMAYRLNKPLTVRLFPVPGLKAGDITTFESDDLCNCAILSVP